METAGAPTTPSSPFACHRVLILNADYRPLGFPLMTLSAPQAIHAMLLERVHVVRESGLYAHSPSMEMRLPSIVALKHYIHVPGMQGPPLFNRPNLFVRDRGLCMYTGRQLRLKTLDRSHLATIDHVVPTCRGGVNGWKNCVLASMSANVQKGDRPLATSGLALIHQPWVPTAADLLYLWLTEERLAHMDENWLEFISPAPSPRVEAFLERLAKAA
jgi:5-methylcytosine-specific restriction endonuclease McrA